MKFKEKKNNIKTKRIIIISAILLVIIAIIVGIVLVVNNSKQNYTVQEISEEDIKYYKVVSNGKTGIIDRDGNEIIPAEYNAIKMPNPTQPIFICIYDYDGATGDYKTKVLNGNAEEILTQYSDVNTIEIKEIVSNVPYEKTVLQYQENDKYGLINFEGKQITKAEYEEIRNMPYREGEIVAKKDGKYGVISINGGKILDFKYDVINGDNYYSQEKEYELDGYIVGINKDNKMQYGYIDNKRQVILETEFDKIYRINNVEDDDNIYLITEKDKKVQLYKNNKLLLDNDYQSIIFNEESKLLIVQKDNKYGALDLEGKQIMNIEYDSLQIPGQYITATKDGETKTYNLSGEVQEVSEFASVMTTDNENYKITIDQNNNYGVISSNNSIVIENNYSYIQYLFGDYFVVGGKDGKSGVINASGEEVLPLQYEVIQKLDDVEILQANTANTTEIYNKDMQLVVQMENGKLDITDDFIKVYSTTDTAYVGKDGALKNANELFPDNGLYAAKKDGKWGFVDKNGNVKIDYQYEKVTELNPKGFAGIKKNGKWGVINKDEEVILEPTYNIPEQNGEPYFIGRYYRVVSGYEDAYFTDEIRE